jgi:hypothetical protein
MRGKRLGFHPRVLRVLALVFGAAFWLRADMHSALAVAFDGAIRTSQDRHVSTDDARRADEWAFVAAKVIAAADRAILYHHRVHSPKWLKPERLQAHTTAMAR